MIRIQFLFALPQRPPTLDRSLQNCTWLSLELSQVTLSILARLLWYCLQFCISASCLKIFMFVFKIATSCILRRDRMSLFGLFSVFNLSGPHYWFLQFILFGYITVKVGKKKTKEIREENKNIQIYLLCLHTYYFPFTQKYLLGDLTQPVVVLVPEWKLNQSFSLSVVMFC